MLALFSMSTKESESEGREGHKIFKSAVRLSFLLFDMKQAKRSLLFFGFRFLLSIVVGIGNNSVAAVRRRESGWSP